MDAGVPISSPVAGIAMGLVIESEKKFTILTDIVGIEDGGGDMDFKVAGTKSGVTALQLDVKTLNLTLPILEKAFAQAKEARAKILKAMGSAIKKPNSSVSKHAPKIKVISIPRDKIGELIGPGGKTIRGIISETEAQVDVEEDGSVFISAITDEALSAAVDKVEALVKEVMPDEIYEGVVKRIESYGVFVEVLPGKEGLVHVSDMSTDYVEDPSKLVRMGDKVKVRVKEIDNMGRINLSMVLDKEKEREKKGPKRGGERFLRARRGRFDSRNRDRGKSRKPRRTSSGPHFPTSRLLDKKDFGR
jgi:polyribonucleotide nucleotidyltransferase